MLLTQWNVMVFQTKSPIDGYLFVYCHLNSWSVACYFIKMKFGGQR